MAVRAFGTTHGSAIPVCAGGRCSGTFPRRRHAIRRLRNLVEHTDWDLEILRARKWVDLFCWIATAFSAVHLGTVCFNLLSR